jgi:hypothetical protein
MCIRDSYYDEHFNNVIKVSKDKYLLAGDIISYSNNLDGAIFTMITEDGKILWKKYIIPAGKDNWGSVGNLHIKRVFTLSDGNIAAVGEANLLYSKTNDDGSVTKWFAPTGVVIKMDQNGSILFAKGYAATKPVWNLQNLLNTQWTFYSITEQNGFIYVIGGGYGPNNAPGYTILLKLDQNGNVIWAKKYRGNDYDHKLYLYLTGHDIVSTNNGGLLTLYGLDWVTDQWIKLNEDGDVEWAGEFNNSSPYFIHDLRDIKKTADGNYILSTLSTGLLKVNPSGKPIKLLTIFPYGILTTTYDNGVAVVSDQTYIISPTLMKLDKISNNYFEFTTPSQNIPYHEITDTIESYPVNVGIIKDFNVVENYDLKNENTTKVNMIRKGLVSNEGYGLNNIYKYDFKETNITQTIGGVEYEKVKIKYNGLVTGIVLQPFNYYDENNKSKIFSWYPAKLYTNVWYSGETGDNGWPKFMENGYLAGDPAPGSDSNTILLPEYESIKDPVKINPFLIKNTFKSFWIPTWVLNVHRNYPGRGLWIVIFNENKDATVLEYDYDTNQTKLIKLPCNEI